MVVWKYVKQEKKYNMNRNIIIKTLFLSLACILYVGQTLAQEQDSILVVQENEKNESSVVNLGYGITLPADESSVAAGVANSKDVSKYFAINPANALYGQIPGLTVLQNGGDWWNQSASLNVRGIIGLGDKISDKSNPLVLIDGFERDLSTITVNEIESVTVLKDAAALALYGQRGANGVIVVTTKRGESEGMRIDVSYEHSFNQAFRMPEMLDAYGYANAMNEALALDGQDYLYTREHLDAYKNGTYPDYYANVNWMDEVLRKTAYVNNINTTFQGGKGRTRYFVSLNYMGGEGLLRQDRNNADYSSQLGYNRTNIRSNLDIEVTKTTMLKFNLAGRISGTNRPGSVRDYAITSKNLFSTLYNTPSNAYPVQYADGSWSGSDTYDINPVAAVNESGYATSHERTFYADLTLTQDLGAILEGLTASGSVSFDNNVTYWDSKVINDYVNYSRTADIDEINGVLYNQTSDSRGEEASFDENTNFGGQARHANGIVKLNYDKQFGDHKLNTTALMHIDNNIIGHNNDNSYTFKRINFAGLIHYAYANKYLADISMSYSGNNILPDDKRFAFYPAASLGWIVSNESFLDGVSAINQLKLRASAGLTGLEPHTDNWYLDLVKYGSGSGYFYADNNSSLGGLKENRRANSDVLPEQGFVTNVGLDAALFGKLNLSVDAFYERRSQILVTEANSTSQVLGVPATFVNDGIVDNQGVEVGALWNQNVGDFNFALGGTFAFARNKIIEQNEEFREWDYLKRTGYSVGQPFGLQDDGFWGENDGLNGVDNVDPNGVKYTYTDILRPGDVKYVDQNGDNVIDQFDEVAIGKSWMPEINYSFTLSAEYKGVGVNAIFQGVSNVSANLNTEGIFWPLFENNNISTFSNDRWTPATATTATLPRLTPEKNENNYRTNTIWQRDASYLKLRSLEVYYHLPESIVNKAKLKTAKVFVRGFNLFSIDNIEIMDPEELGAVYPTLRSFNVGVNIGF